MASINDKNGWQGFIATEASTVKDQWGEPVSNVSQVWIEPQSKHSPAADAHDAGWLPSKRFADAWLAFERQPEHPITPLE